MGYCLPSDIRRAAFPTYHVEVYRFIDLIPPMVILAGKAISWLLTFPIGRAKSDAGRRGSKTSHSGLWQLACIVAQAFRLLRAGNGLARDALGAGGSVGVAAGHAVDPLHSCIYGASR